MSTNEKTTDALAARAAGGDRDALAALYAAHQDTVLDLVAGHLHGASSADIEDAAQDVWVEVCVSIGDYKSRKGFVLWLADLVLMVAVQLQLADLEFDVPAAPREVEAPAPVRNPFANPLRLAGLRLAVGAA